MVGAKLIRNVVANACAAPASGSDNKPSDKAAKMLNEQVALAFSRRFPLLFTYALTMSLPDEITASATAADGRSADMDTSEDGGAGAWHGEDAGAGAEPMRPASPTSAAEAFDEPAARPPRGGTRGRGGRGGGGFNGPLSRGGFGSPGDGVDRKPRAGGSGRGGRGGDRGREERGDAKRKPAAESKAETKSVCALPLLRLRVLVDLTRVRVCRRT